MRKILFLSLLFLSSLVCLEHLPIWGALSPSDCLSQKENPMHWAATANDKAAIEMFINVGADLNRTDQYGATPLHCAARYGSVDVARLLLNANARPNEVDNQGWTPLHTAVNHNRGGMVQLLLSANVNLNAVDFAGKKPLCHALELKVDGAIIGSLIATGADVNEKYGDGKAALHWTVKDRSCSLHAIMQLFVPGWLTRQGINPNRIQRDVSNTIGFFCDPSFWQADAMGILLDNHADVNITDNDHNTPLHLAAKHDCRGSAQILIQRGADLNKKNNDGETALHIAAKEGHAEIVQLFLHHGALPIKVKKNIEEPLPLLIWALKEGKVNVVEVILTSKRKDFINVEDKNGDNPLCLAVKSDNIEVVTLLLDHGALPHVVISSHVSFFSFDHLHYYLTGNKRRRWFTRIDKKSKPLLIWAIENEKKELIKAICAFKRDDFINVKDDYELTPLHLAAERLI